MINFLKKLDRKMAIYLGIAIGSIIFLIILLIVLKSAVGTRINTKTFEKKLETAAKDYYKKYDKKMPKTNGDKTSISIDDLVDAGYLKDPNKLLKKGITCEGGVNVSNNNGYYLYQPVIECSDGYSTNVLYKKILENNKNRQDRDGLYKINNYYLFRGEQVNNYVKFAGKIWRILRINEDNTVRLILADKIDSVVWDDRYNDTKNDSVGKNDYEISRIKQVLNDYFTDADLKYFSSEDKALIVPTELCIGARNELFSLNDGSIECSKKTEKYPIGLLQVNEYPIVSLDENCRNISDIQCINYNYLANFNSFWTITPDSTNTYKVYRVSGTARSSNANSYAQPRMVINISPDALCSEGNGTYEKPYIIK